MPTYRFFLFLMGVFAAWLFYLFYVGWFGIFFLYALISILVADLVCSIPGMVLCRVNVTAPVFVYRGLPAVVTVITAMPAHIRVGSVKIRYRLHNVFYDENTDGRAAGGVSGGKFVQFELSTDKCGCIEVKLKRVWIGDLLGFFAVPKKCRGVVKSVVLPLGAQPYVEGDIKSLSSDRSKLKAKRGGGVAEDHDLREYQEGDPVRSIHWKLSAKMNKAIVREALVPEKQGVSVMFDLGAQPEETLDSLKWLCAELLADNLDVCLSWTLENGVTVVRSINSVRDFERALGELLSIGREKIFFTNRVADGMRGAVVKGRRVRPL